MSNLIWKLWMVVAVILLWSILIPLFIVLLPLFIVVCVTKNIEEFIYRVFFNSLHFKIEEMPWLYDTPNNPTIINSLVVMETRMSIEAIRDALNLKFVNALKDDEKTLKYPRATRYIHAGFLNFYWLKEKNFQLESHVYEWDKHCYESEADVKDIISRLATRPLITPENLSPWEYILIHFKGDDGVERSALFLRSHHSLADGVSQIYFLVNQINDNKLEYEGAGHHNLTTAEKLMIRIKSILLFPYNALGQSPRFFKPIKTLFDCEKTSGKKRLTYSKPINLNLIKAVKRKLNVTVNDVMSGCLATCLHNYIRKQGDQVPDDFHVAIPLDTRLSIDEAKEFSNKISVSQFMLPVSSGDPVKNILEMNKRMQVVKENLVGFSIRLTMRIIGYFTPMVFTNYVISGSIRSVNMVLSNVPGPQDVVSISGHKIRFLTFWPPARDKISSSCSIFSYNGNIYLGICSDEAVTKYPERMIADMDAVLDSLQEFVGLKAPKANGTELLKSQLKLHRDD